MGWGADVTTMIATPPSRKPRSTGTAVLHRTMLVVSVPVVLIVVWGVAAAIANSTVIVGPAEAFVQMVDSLASPRYRENLAITAQTVSVAFLASVAIGGVLGFLLGIAPFWERALGPIMQGLYSIPKVTIFPLFLVFLGMGIVSRTSFAFMHGVFPMIIVVMAATANLRMTDIYLKLAASLNMSFAQLARTVLLPAVLPSFLTATRLAFGLTFLGAILAEMFASNGGLGDELVRNMHLVRVDRILGQVVLIGIYALIPNALLRLVEVRIARRMAGDVGRVQLR